MRVLAVAAIAATIAAAMLGTAHVTGAPAPQAAPTTTRPEWDDPSVLHTGTERPHATMTRYADGGEVVGDSSRWVLSLNGQWKFHLSPDPASRPVNFFDPRFNDSDWSTIRVPGSWELQGFGIPIYVN